jgi:hypothetical protein
MAEYYVVRDKNTGLYFRGKGVNRWGKYYNQACIYRIRANAENTLKAVSRRGEQAEIVPIQIFENSADVVEVVRCRDCVNRVEFDTNKFHCELTGYYCGETGYCSDAVRTPKERGVGK